MNNSDKTHQPNLEEIETFIQNTLFGQFRAHLEATYRPQVKIDYSGETNYDGWNVKFRKAGKALCTVYPREGYFTVLVVVGRKEKETVEALLTHASAAFTACYHGTKEGNAQRWLMIDLYEADDLYRDVLQVIAIRRHTK